MEFPSLPYDIDDYCCWSDHDDSKYHCNGHTKIRSKQRYIFSVSVVGRWGIKKRLVAAGLHSSSSYLSACYNHHNSQCIMSKQRWRFTLYAGNLINSTYWLISRFSNHHFNTLQKWTSKSLFAMDIYYSNCFIYLKKPVLAYTSKEITVINIRNGASKGLGVYKKL